MNILIHEKNVRRNAKIGQYTSLASLVILAGGMYVSFVYPNLLYISFIALLVGFVLSQVGIYYGNRWGRHPRVDERLTATLKGLTKDYTMYHYLTPVNHLLVGPAGVWVIEPYYQRGTIVYDGKKWKQKYPHNQRNIRARNIPFHYFKSVCGSSIRKILSISATTCQRSSSSKDRSIGKLSAGV